MKGKQPADIPASVLQRLLNLARAEREDFSLVLKRYASERLLYRLSLSPHGHRFVLKGALLFALWTGRMHRPTRDLDMLSYGNNSPEALGDLFKELCAVPVEADGLEFDPSSIRISEIREDQEYMGRRVHMLAMLGKARIQLHVDIGIGDIVVPAPEEVDYPVMLQGFRAPRIRAYSKEAAIAEKLHATVVLGMANSRMKDFYDLWVMAREFEFDGATLARAVAATFERRNTAVPQSMPVALTDNFAGDPAKQAQWQAFLKRNSLDAPELQLRQVIRGLRDFLLPPLELAAKGHFGKHWPPGGPWT